jgi:hypothetical protein
VVFRPDTAVFGLPFKESSVTDTMTLHGFSDRLADGNYLVPVKIGPITVGEFGARHFRADIDTTRRVVVVSGKMNPPVRQTLQRMGIASRVIQRDEDLGRIDTAPCDVVVIDRNALVTVPALRGAKDPLRRFMGGGGKVVILAQDADVWASAPLVDGLSLTDTLAGRMIAQLRPDTTQYPFSGPNTIGTELTMGWTSRMFYNAVSSTMSAVRLTGPAGALIITGTEGKGGWTYVDLALDPQWMNVDPSAFRLLANIVSAR